MKSRLRTEEPAKAVSMCSSRRPAVLAALTVACVLAHAAVLGALPRLHTAPKLDVAQRAVVRLVPASMHIPTTLQPVVDVEQRDSLSELPAPAPTPIGRAASVVLARTTPAAPLEAVSSAPPLAPDPATKHLPTSALDLPPMPRSAPDEQQVEHVHRSGLPMQIRLFIDANGSVTETSLLGTAPGDEEAAEQVMAMFRETAFSPGRLQGREVASFIDIELVLEPTLPPLGRIVRQ